MGTSSDPVLFYGFEIVQDEAFDEDDVNRFNKLLQENFGERCDDASKLVSVEVVGNRCGDRSCMTNILCTYYESVYGNIGRIMPPATVGQDAVLMEAAQLLGLETTTAKPEWHLAVIIG